MLRKAAFLMILVISAPAAAADSDTASNLNSGSDSLSVLAFAILFVGLARLLVPEKPRRVIDDRVHD